MNKKILIYSSRGVSRQSLKSLVAALNAAGIHKRYQIEKIDADSIINSNWESRTSLLAIPGGRDLFYHERLKGPGNKRIRQWVEGGGAFFGVCAGAYYGSAAIEFEKGTELHIEGLRELAFYPGLARGAAYGPGLFRYNSDSGCRAAPLKWHLQNSLKGGPLFSYFHGGCLFVDADTKKGVTTLASYDDIAGRPAAIVECRVGSGKAILSGVHPEFSACDLHGNTKQTLEIKELLKTNDDSRRRLFLHLIDRLLQLPDL